MPPRRKARRPLACRARDLLKRSVHDRPIERSIATRLGYRPAIARPAPGRRQPLCQGKLVSHADATKLLEAVVRPGDRVCLEGDNQKQADFLAARLAEVDPSVVKDLHIVQSGVVLAEHLDLFEAGIAKRLDFSYSGPQGAAIARALKAGKIELGAVHTYLELFSRYFVDLTPACRAHRGALRGSRRQSLYGSEHRGSRRW